MTPRFSNPLRQLLASVFLAGACATASAALVSYEGFAYTNGSNLTGAGGGSGFSADWLAASGAIGTGLNWPSLPTTGGAASIASASNTTTYRTFPNRAGTDTWLAYLFRRDSSASGDCNVVIGSGVSEVGQLSGGLGGTGGLRIGHTGPAGNLTTAPVSSSFSLTLNDPVPPVQGGDISTGQTRLILVHLDYANASGGTMRVYFDPNLSQTLGSPNQSYSFTLASLDRIALKGSVGFTVDEIRVGDIYQDVIGNNDPDGDLVTSEVEATIGSNPLLLDTDGDGFNDATETLNGTNPASASSVPGTTRIERVFGFGPARGLDLSGNFLYAFNVGPVGAAGQAGDATFTADDAAGITVHAPNNPIAVWNNPSFGSTSSDDALELVYQSIRWADHNWGAPDRTLRVDLANLVVGRNYKLQLLIADAGSTGRRFDVLANGTLLANDFAPTDAQGAAYASTAGSAIVHEFTATSGTLNIVLDGVTDVADVPFINRDSYLNGATLEEIPTAAPAPGITPAAAGAYTNSVTVTLVNNAAGTTLRYTIDGSTPSDTDGTVYTGPFTLESSATVKVIATGGGWLASSVVSADYTVTIAPLAGWRTLQGLAANGSQDLANPSGDGIPNLVKYAFNLAPNAGDLATANATILAPSGSTGLPRIGVDSEGRLVVEFLRRKAATNPGVVYSVETSADLAAWPTLDLAGATVTSIDADWERVSVTDPVVTPRRFGRVRVAVPAP